jgi:hypothetical protein
MKVCSKCKVEKSYECFSKNNAKKDGLCFQCKECASAYNKLYEKTEKRRSYLSSDSSKERRRLRSKFEYAKDTRKEYVKEYLEKNKEYIREYKRAYNTKRKQTDTLYKLKSTFRSNITKCFKRINHKKSSPTTEILGCSFDYFKLYIESKFENWMTWDNYGNSVDENGMSWDLDHIVPLSTATTKEEMEKLNHYTNFQPLDSRINRFQKKDKIEYQPVPPPPFPTK